MSAKKTAIFASIIILTLSATGFILYKNNRPSYQAPALIDDSAKVNLSTDAMTAISDSEKALNRLKIDLTILGSAKFKALQENVLIPREQADPGKPDPFKPN